MRFHIVKRDSCPFWKKLCLYLAAVAAALVLGGLLLMVMGVDPIAYYQRMFTMGMVGNKIAYKTFENYLKVFVPLVLTSVALSLAFKMRFWNIGGEGQFILGAVAAAAVALKLKDGLPQGVVLILMCLAGMAAAGLYGALAAVLKVKFGTNETLMTLMLNYVALYFLIFLGETQAEWNFFLDTSSARPVFFNFGKEVAFPRIMIGKFGLNVCVLLTLLIGVLVYCYLKYSKHGYEIAVVGDSPNTARYAGMKVGRIVVRTIFLSAALIGLAGAFYVSSAGTLSTSVTNDVGWTGIVVAWLAKLNTVGIVITALLITVLQFGCQAASTTYSSIDANFADLIQGIILFAVLAADFFTRFRLARRAAAPKEVSK